MDDLPTTAFVNAALFDGHRYRGQLDGAVVVEGGRITGISEPPADAVVVDAGGGLLAPGFIDAHVHAVQGGMELTLCNLADATTREEYLAIIASYAESHPDEPWILGGGWAMAAFPGGTPTAADLDAVVPDRPVFLPNRDHHGAWVNTRAMEIAGIRRDSPEPPHGRYERDATGAPTGTVHEGAMDVVARHTPVATAEQYYAGLLAGQSYLHSLGVTGWQDAIIGDSTPMDDTGPTYVEAAQRGDLTAHVVGALWWDRDAGEEQVESLIERRRAFTHGRFRATSVKVMQDGVVENFTAAMTTPYLDREGRSTGESGHSFVDPLLLRQYVARLDAEGFQVHVHAIGDRAVREALDAFEGVSISRAGCGRQHAGAVGMSRRSDGRPDAAPPR
jgi:predicted amidohydrolase YtcJ